MQCHGNGDQPIQTCSGDGAWYEIWAGSQGHAPCCFWVSQCLPSYSIWGSGRNPSRQVREGHETYHYTLDFRLPGYFVGWLTKVWSFKVLLFKFTMSCGMPCRFVRRGRSQWGEDAEIDLEATEVDPEDVRIWLDKPKGAIWSALQGGDSKPITKFLSPGTVTDLYTHYQATRQLLGAAAVSSFDIPLMFGFSLFFWCPFLGAKCSPFLAPFTVPNQWEYYQCQCVTKIKSNEFRKIEFVHFQMSRYSTFLSIYKEKWSDILKFRQKSMLLAKG